jgi:hypothetical protein
MHWLRAGSAALAGANAALFVAAGSPAPDQPASCNALTHVCKVVVKSPGSSASPAGAFGAGRSSAGAQRAQSGASPAAPDPCHYQLADPQPPASDPVWNGHLPGSGAVYEYVCPVSFGTLVARTVFVANGAAAAPVVTPAELAREAVARVRLPGPAIERSPPAANSDQGMPYTWVNLWTWFWTSPQTWQPLTRTAAAGAVWARATIRPDRLVFDPGDGEPGVTCTGPGRPWQAADSNSPPSDGGCGYVYRHVTASGPVTATVSIRWVVTWTGSGGATGTLPEMTTSAVSRFMVEQIEEVVVR